MDEKGDWHAFFRSSRGLGKIYHSVLDASDWEDDEWTSPEPTHLPNPNSGVDTLYMDDRLFLVYNPSETMRAPLVIAELDEDFEVIDEIIIQNEVKKILSTATRELSYPYMVENKGKINLVYTYGRSAIEYVTVEI